MTIIDQLKSYLDSPFAPVRISASKVSQAAVQLATGKITKPEYDALCRGATDLDAIHDDMMSVDELKAAQIAINAIAQIAESYIP